MTLSVIALNVPVSRFCPEGGKCFGIDVSAGVPAPLDELSTANAGFDRGNALCFESLDVLLSSGFPSLEIWVPNAIRKDGAE